MLDKEEIKIKIFKMRERGGGGGRRGRGEEGREGERGEEKTRTLVLSNRCNTKIKCVGIQ